MLSIFESYKKICSRRQGFPGGLALKNPPAMMHVLFLGWEEPLDEGTATHPSILARRIPRTEEPGGLQFIGLQRVKHDGSDSTHTCTHAIHSYFIILGRDYCVCSIVFAFSPQDDVPSLSTLLIF